MFLCPIKRSWGAVSCLRWIPHISLFRIIRRVCIENQPTRNGSSDSDRVTRRDFDTLRTAESIEARLCRYVDNLLQGGIYMSVTVSEEISKCGF